MTYLLDTHALLWHVMKASSLSERARKIILNGDNELYVSTISFWEITLKHSLGKLPLTGVEPEDFEEILYAQGIGIIGLNERESLSFHRLPLIKDHRDPFDRMLVWQAICRGMTLISNDQSLEQYRSNGLRLAW